MEFEQIASEIKKYTTQTVFPIGIVKAVDKENSICSVELLEDESIVIENVRLQAVDSEQDNGFLLLPKVGSSVIIGKIDNQSTFFVAMVSEVQEVYLKVDGSEKFSITKDEIKFDGGTKGSMIEIAKAVSRMNLIENKVNELITAYNAHLSNPDNTPASVVSGTLATTTISNLENSKIKQ